MRGVCPSRATPSLQIKFVGHSRPHGFTPEALTPLIGELKDALASEPEPTDKEQKKVRREQEIKINELEKHRNKLGEYDSRIPTDEVQHGIPPLPTLRQRQGHNGLCLLRHRPQHQGIVLKDGETDK